MKHAIRHPAVSGSFYPSDKKELRSLVTGLLQNSPAGDIEKGSIRAIMVPHAGYSFSGGIAAMAYNTIRKLSCNTVFIVGNAHTHPFEGIALDCHEVWESPLGKVQVNTTLAEQLHTRYPELCFCSEAAHLSDHILEVQLPFIQCVLEQGYTILPLLFGINPPDTYDAAARIILGVLQPGDLFIASSDLSHYPSYRNANTIDRTTIEYIVNKDIHGLEQHKQTTLEKNVPHEETLFCGPDAIKTLMQLANLKNWKATMLCYANSGDAPFADKETVVGYGAVAFYES